MEAKRSTETHFDLQKERNRLEMEIIELRDRLKSPVWDGFSNEEKDIEETEFA